MTAAVLLGVLAILDCALAGFRAAAGRNGELHKQRYYNRAMASGALRGSGLVIVIGALALGLDAWTEATAAARTLVWIYGTYATVVLTAFAFYFMPIGCYRVLTSVIVFGPLTLLRRAVIAAGMLVVVVQTPEPRVVVLAVLAGAGMLAVEPWLGRRYSAAWRGLLRAETTEGPGGNPDLRSSVTN